MPSSGAGMTVRSRCAHCRESVDESESMLSLIAERLREKLAGLSAEPEQTCAHHEKPDFRASDGKSYNFCAIMRFITYQAAG